MANTSSAKKAKRVAERRRVFNVRRKKTLHDAAKAFQKSASAGSFSAYQQALDKAAKANVLTRNTAARLKSRASRRLIAKK